MHTVDLCILKTYLVAWVFFYTYENISGGMSFFYPYCTYELRKITKEITHVIWIILHLCMIRFNLCAERCNQGSQTTCHILGGGYIFANQYTDIPRINRYPGVNDIICPR
jgi:hypothetical protein